MNVDQKHIDDVAYFLAFCIETYKNARSMSGEEVSDLFSETGLSEFLVENFETLHSQSHQWILEEIEEYLTTQRK